MGNPVVHFEIMGGAGKDTENFYREAFGWKIDSDNEFDYGVVDPDAGGRGIAGGVGPATQGPARITVYVEVPDIDAKLAEIEKLGGKTMMGREDIGMVIIAMFQDPGGNVIGLIENAQT
jgi:uncharacterized protein